MQNLIPLIFGALFVYLLFFRKGGMGMGCCGGHNDHDGRDRHGGHGHESNKDWHFNGLSKDRKENVIDLSEDQYTVLSNEKDEHLKAPDRTVSQKLN